MKIQLANNSENALYITSLTRNSSSHVNDSVNEEIIQINSISINIEDAQDGAYELAKAFFENGDLSTMYVYNNNGRLLLTLFGKELGSITQAVDDSRSVIYVNIILQD